MASFDDESKGSIANVKENVRVRSAVGDKARALRERCEAALGPKFTLVYDFLRKVRSTQAGMNANEKNEKEVSRASATIRHSLPRPLGHRARGGGWGVGAHFVPWAGVGFVLG